MAFTKKEWKDRVSQYPNRRSIYDGVMTKTVTVSRAEGSVTEAGDSFNAANMNDLEDRINEAFTNIIHTPRVNDKTPYQYRQTPVNANRCLEKLIGVSCAFNQLVQNGNFADTSNWSTVDSTFAVSDNVGTYTRTATSDILGYYSFPASLNHKYICSFDCRSSAGGFVELSNIVNLGSINVVANTWTKFTKIGVGVADATAALRINADGGVGDTLDLRNFNIIDLTACFGSEVADYLYNLENS